ncbi:outer membrane lipoprotein carrier protein LolA [Pseudomonas sp. RIT-PI-S]|uniref:outer membrane lipoprotein carrier protein LolA n=1 Tax=Pseudomonas sp. RIT-PI-S TaxID=3035295 RepID=UPI0021D90230|nr:outer membrane lipoprotein carrier protein LolA [Pseudomonas sp. RIT-PI-S]
MTALKRLLLLLCLLPGLANAFGLPELSAQLGQPQVVRGPFIQEKFLRALPQPLTSQGQFVLAKAHGLLWQLQRPLRQDIRINADGIARRDASGWQALPGSHAGAQQNRLFFAVLQGDSSALERDFELAVSGDSQAWAVQLTPRSALLKQVFQRIEIRGGAYVQRIELFETQGDRTVLTLPASTGGNELTEPERRDFAE